MEVWAICSVILGCRGKFGAIFRIILVCSEFLGLFVACGGKFGAICGIILECRGSLGLFVPLYFRM